MMLPQGKDTRHQRNRRQPADTDWDARAFGRPSKNPAILGAIILVFIVLGTLLTSRIETPPSPDVEQADLVARGWREVDALAMALEKFHRDTGCYPTATEGLVALVQDPGSVGWNGHYVNLIQPDPWQTPYRYTLTTDGPEVRSAGPDRTFNTDADIYTTAQTDDAN